MSFQRFWECDPGCLRTLFSQKDGALGKGSEGASDTGQCVLVGGIREKVALRGEHADMGLGDPSFSSCPAQARLAVVLPLWNKVSANKGPFHELQAGP